MGPLFCLLGVFVITVAGSSCSDRNSCSMKLYEFENCLKTQHTAMEVRLQALETEMKELHEDTSYHASFLAGITPSVKLVNRSMLIFNNVMLNKGGGYNGTSGIFTAPVKGVYSFTLTIGLHAPEVATNNLEFHIMKSTEIVGFLFIEWEGKWLKRSESTVVDLQAGDRIHVMVAIAPDEFDELPGASDYPGSAYNNHFSGFLIEHEH
ncbi:cerebellin-3-like [Ostrea edulis]|uniref:cerebellin-3-like n=1 Tax=Ostrea edulis TaxID=37623 RepID=UPI0024AF1BF9|nr:cerebellin-3-like [Ostrea edulis]